MDEMFKGQHNFVCGMTGTGKTTFVIEHLKRSSLPCLFFNVQKIDTPFIKCDGNCSAKDIINSLKRGDKLDFIPEPRKLFMKGQINYLVNELFAVDYFRNKPFLFVIDEAHIIAAQGDKNDYINMIPTRGRSLGFTGVFIAQRPALVDKTIVSQCTKHVIFATEYEGAYFRTKGLDDEKIKTMLGGDIHNYVIYERGIYTGAFKEKL